MTTKKSYLFPSPIGELHFSMITKELVLIGNLTEFPSPIGELHFSINKLYNLKEVDQFPSPIGELHFSISFTG